jgi:uncharacterized membrane protein HdeD (DUF308 family)
MFYSLQASEIIKKNSGWFIAWGIALLILGIIAVSLATLSTLASVVILGIFITIAGIVLFIGTLHSWRHKWGEFLWNLFISILYIAAGVWLLTHPGYAAMALTLMLGVFYICLGFFRTLSSAVLRFPEWGWVFFSGLVTLLLGIVILMYWPAASLFIIGLIVGIDLIFLGWSNLRLGWWGARS